MSNSSGALSATTESAIDNLYDILYAWIAKFEGPILLSLGTLGNVLQFIVLSMQIRKSCEQTTGTMCHLLCYVTVQYTVSEFIYDVDAVIMCLLHVNFPI